MCTYLQEICVNSIMAIIILLNLNNVVFTSDNSNENEIVVQCEHHSHYCQRFIFMVFK